ncbi:MAG: family 43 glycosylhydrolase [Cytophagales bacterium]|nr:family 43 glycosylhydrolase [Cytophagales bacterium]
MNLLRKYTLLKQFVFTAILLAISTSCNGVKEHRKRPEEGRKNDFAPEEGVVRRDPSDIIRANDKYYIYYTKMVRSEVEKRVKELGVPSTYPAGYHGDVYAAVSTDEGHNWKELGAVVTRGAQGNWDSNSVFTPNVVRYQGKYYLYFTAVGTGFTNQGYTDYNRTAIGVAVADRPEGPFVKKEIPVLESTRDSTKFDSFRVDDSALRIVDGKTWLYYKGRQWGNTPAYTKIGLAIADKPDGVFVRQNNGDPIQNGGHEVLVWEHENHVFSYVHHGHGPQSGTIRRTRLENGREFEAEGAIAGAAPRLNAPGLYRPELTGRASIHGPHRWGIHMKRHGRTHISLHRFTIDMSNWVN